MYTYFVAPLKTILSHSLIFSFVSRKKETERVTTRSMFSRYVSSSLSRIVEIKLSLISHSGSSKRRFQESQIIIGASVPVKLHREHLSPSF